MKKEIFRAYDIRGIYGTELTEEICFAIGFRFAKNLKKENINKIYIGYDGRNSSEEICKNLILGINNAGLETVFNIGLVPTPLLYYITFLNNSTGIMITGSHNPKEYNGMKIVKEGKPFFGQDISELYQNIEEEVNEIIDLFKLKKEPKFIELDIKDKYIEEIFNNLNLDLNLNAIFDSANGATGEVINLICKKYLQNSIATYTEIDGNFPNHHADPSDSKNLVNLISNVKKNNQIGIMFDGDGDRVAFVDEEGKILSNYEMIFIFAKEVIKTQKNKKIVLDIKCSHFLISELEKIGAEVFIVKTGHPFIKNKMKEINAAFGAELSGHIFFRDKYFGFDDGVYSSLRMLEILTKEKQLLKDLRKDFIKIYGGTEIKFKCEDNVKFEIIEKIKNQLISKNEKFLSIDGVKCINDNGSFLIRASNTTPNIILVCDALSDQYLSIIENNATEIINFNLNKL